MTIIEAFQHELEGEAINTRKMFAQIPEDKWDWQPHQKSMSLKRLANHIAELPAWIGMVLFQDELDFATSPYQPTTYSNTPDLMDYFEKTLQLGKMDLEKADLAEMNNNWTLRDGQTVFTQSTKYEMLRMTFSQIIHHRAQLGVYLRLLDIPIPGSYGPSADEEG